MNVSLRMLHIKNQPAWKKPFVKGVQSLFRDTPLGTIFFNQVANTKASGGLNKWLSPCSSESINDMRQARTSTVVVSSQGPCCHAGSDKDPEAMLR